MRASQIATTKGLIIMKRTIITAQGERLIMEGQGKRLIIRALIITFCIIGALIISAAVIGFTRTPHTAGGDNTATFNDGWDTGLQDILEIGKGKGGMQKLQFCINSSRDASAFHSCIDR